MATFVLVPGFWLGAWAWDDVATALRGAGHEVRPLTLTGVGERAAEAMPAVDVDTHTADVVAALEAVGAPSVLVAHSGGALPATAAAERVPALVSRIVYVDSAPLPDGMSQLDFNDPDAQAREREAIARDGGGRFVPVPAGLPGVDGETLERVRKLMTPQPVGTATQPVRRAPGGLPVPASAVMCTIAPDVVRALAAAGNALFAEAASLDLRHLPSSHWPMFTAPAELAALLGEFTGPAVTG